MRIVNGTICFWACALLAVHAHAAGPISMVQWDQKPAEWHEASDGKNGALAAWVIPKGSLWSIGAQRMTFNSHLPWGPSGVELEASDAKKTDLHVLPDGRGGAILGWQEESGLQTRFWIQNITAQGRVRWPGSGLLIATRAGPQSPIAMDIDRGRILLAWEEQGSTSAVVRCQRYDQNGQPKWPEAFTVASVSGPMLQPAIIPDRDGGFFIVWSTEGEGGNSQWRGQSMNASGRPVWDPEGIVVSTHRHGSQLEAGGTSAQRELVLVWRDRSAIGDSWGAQLLDSSGQRRWGSDGILLNSLDIELHGARVAMDESGRFALAWEEVRGGHRQVFAQQWNTTGQPAWGISSVAVTRSPGICQQDPFVADDSHEVFVLWRDCADNAGAVYAQRIKEGNLSWDSGLRVSRADLNAGAPVGISDHSGGLLVMWLEPMKGQGQQLKALRVGRSEIAE